MTEFPAPGGAATALKTIFKFFYYQSVTISS